MIDSTTDIAPLNILLIDNHPLFVDGVKALLSQLRKHINVDVAYDFSNALSQLKNPPNYDLVILDFELPDTNNDSAIEYLLQSFSSISLVILSANENQSTILNAIKLGVLGYIPKSTRGQITLSALNLILAGGTYIPKTALSLEQSFEGSHSKTINNLEPSRSVRSNITNNEVNELLTKRQITILSCLSEGLSNKHIARQLNIADGTVRVHMSTIYRVLGVENRTQAVVKANKLGLA